MKTKALFTYDYGEEYNNKIKELGYDITIIPEREVKYSEDIKDTEVLVCYHPFKTLDISKLKKLKFIQLSSTGIDQLPKKELSEDVVVCNNKGGYSIAIGEWMVMSTLNLLKKTKNVCKRQEEKKWKLDNSWLELYEKKVAFLGTGTLACEGAKRLQGFGVEVVGFNTKGIGTKDIERCYPMKDVMDMIHEFDVIICALPGTKETENMVDKKMFSKMKDGVFFLNPSRGSVVDEKALIKYLKNGKIKGAALDVFGEEPLPEEHEFWELENVMISSHNSWISEKRNSRRMVGIIENLKRYREDRDLVSVVKIDKGY